MIIGIYPWFLINDHEVPLIKLARLQNDDMINYYAGLLEKKIPKNGKVLIIGLTFREGVKELAYTRSIPMIRLLESKGYDVYVYDPMYTEEEVTELGFKYSDDFGGMDGLILMNFYTNLKL